MELSEEEMIDKIVESAGISREDLLKKVEEKLEEFGGLVSRAGAIIIVGKELGVDLVERKPKILKVKNLIPGLNQVNLKVKVIRIYSSHEFSRKDGGAGKVVNLLVGDDTGVVRVSVWNEKVKLLQNIKEGDVIEILNGYTREDDFDGVEVRVGKQGSIRKVEGIEISVPEECVRGEEPKKRAYREISLDDAKVGDAVVCRCTVSLIFDRPVLHYLCPICKSKLTGKKCEKHGDVKPDRFLVLSGIVDDGTAAVNFVAFRKNVEKLVGMSVDEIEEKIKIMGEKRFFEEHVMMLIGKEVMVRGLLKKNELSDFVELVATKVEDVHYPSLLEKMLEDVERVVEAGG